MNPSDIRLGIDHQGVRKILVIPNTTNQKQLLIMCLELFHIEEKEATNYIILLKALECEVEDPKHLLMNEILVLQKKSMKKVSERSSNLIKDMSQTITSHLKNNDINTDVKSEDLEKETKCESDATSETALNQILNQEFFAEDPTKDQTSQDVEKITNLIDVEVLFNEEFSTRKELGKEIKTWAVLNKMSLYLSTTERDNKKTGIQVTTLHCTQKTTHDCKFYLEFRTDLETKLYSLHSYFNEHNHKLYEYDSAMAITEEIAEKIGDLHNHGADVPTITNIINSDFDRNFHRGVIYYQLKKYKDNLYGKINEDANKLVKMLERDANERGGFYKIDTNIEDQLTKCCYMSARMKKILNTFPEVIIIDGTFKTNRFGMHLVDVITVNNLGNFIFYVFFMINVGKSITCFFSLLNDQTYESFLWAMNQLRSQMETVPHIIFSDEEEALGKGIFKIYFVLFVF